MARTPAVWADGSFPPLRGRRLAAPGRPPAHPGRAARPGRTPVVNDELRPVLGADTRVSVIAHSFAGTALGFAERAGLNAEATNYLAAPGIGIGMWDVHNSRYDPGSESWVNVYNVITNWPDATATP